MQIVVGTATEQNRQPEPPERKPNEDYVAYARSESGVIAVVMDGIPVLRTSDGSYPRENGAVASQIAANMMRELLAPKSPNLDDLRQAFGQANQRIKRENNRLQMYLKTPPHWLATVGCALWADSRSEQSFFGYIDDPLAFVVSPDFRVTLLTEDQHAPSEGHFWAKHQDEMNSQDPAGNSHFREHQDRFVRNCVDAHCWCGERFRGWGALTGKETAMDFVTVSTVATQPGTRIVLASDAIEAIGRGQARERITDDYRTALLDTLGMKPQAAAVELIRLIRRGEDEKRCKSDDTAIAVIDFKI